MTASISLMRRYALLLGLLLMYLPGLSAQERGLSEFITGLSEDAERLAGMPVQDFSYEDGGVLITLEAAGGIPLRIALLDRIEAGKLVSPLQQLTRYVLSPEARNGKGRSVAIGQVLVSVGKEGDLLAELEISSLEIRLRRGVYLEFAKRLSGPLSLWYRPSDEQVSCALPLRGIPIQAVRSGRFPGWDGLHKQLLEWAQEGLGRNDREVMGTLMEIRRLEESELEQEKELIFESRPNQAHRASLHFSLEASVPEMTVSRAEGVEIGIPSIMLQPTFTVELLGKGSERLFKPYSFWLGFGPFVDLRLYTALYEEYGSLYQILPTGLTLSGGFSGYMPRIENNRLTGTAFGIGGEVQTRLNIAGLALRGSDDCSPLLAGDYLLDVTPLAVLHIFPRNFHTWDLTIGFPFKFFPNCSKRSIELYSVGLSLGMRLRFTLHRYYRPAGSQ